MPELRVPDLSIEDTADPHHRELYRPGAVSQGFNPYDTAAGSLAPDARRRQGERPRRTDLRRLSEWIRLQRRLEEQRSKEPPEEPAAAREPAAPRSNTPRRGRR